MNECFLYPVYQKMNECFLYPVYLIVPVFAIFIIILVVKFLIKEKKEDERTRHN